MLIILEGPDGSGKTTLAKNLIRELAERNFPVIYSHSPGYFEGVIFYKVVQSQLDFFSYIENLRNKVNGICEDNLWSGILGLNPPTLIQDRFFLFSEEVYGNILRGKNSLQNYYDYHLLFRKFLNFYPLIIYCRPPKDLIKSSVENSQQNHPIKVVENILEIVSSYDDLMDNLPVFLKYHQINHNLFDINNQQFSSLNSDLLYKYYTTYSKFLPYVYDYTSDPEAKFLIETILNPDSFQEIL